MNSSCMRNKRISRLAWIFLLFAAVSACSSDDSVPPKEAGFSQTHNWQRISVTQLNESGTTIPYVVARPAADGNVHIAYYGSAAAPDGTPIHRLNYLIWNPATQAMTTHVVENRPGPTGYDGFDRCDQFDLALDGTTPVFIYPTYEIHPTMLQAEADIMVNLFDGASWNEATGAIGFVERNPVFQDGHATENMSVTVDDQGNVHLCYQFFTEGIDSANYRYPDLHYVFRDRATLFDPMATGDYQAIEEHVDGNQFTTFGIHNSVGFHCKVLLDPDGMPVIVYGEYGEQFNGEFALKVAYRNAAGQWRREIVDALPDGWTLSGISAAFYPPDPENPEAERALAIAYALHSPSPEPDDGHRLLFAVKREGQWTTEIVDETTWCGADCVLAFTPDGYPAIAYFDEQSHSGRPHQFLKYAEFNGVLWSRESAEEQGIVGRYNSLWFDAAGRANICTYSDEDNEILIIRRIN